jgi:hypothetical protein
MMLIETSSQELQTAADVNTGQVQFTVLHSTPMASFRKVDVFWNPFQTELMKPKSALLLIPVT